MLTSLARRAALVSIASGLVVAAVASGSAASGATRHPAAHSNAKITTASLSAVSVAPHSTTAFALGMQSTNAGSTPYALRRSGSHWSKVTVKLPSPVTSDQLFDVAAGSPHSAWIVGDVFGGTSDTTLIEHSTGGGFKPEKTSIGQGQFLSVSASSASNAWAVGDGLPTSTPLIAHWNGHKWAVLKDTKQTGFNDSEVSTSSAKNVWILGTDVKGVVVTFWNGHKFKVMQLTLPAGASVNRIATTSSKNTWVAGSISVGTTTLHPQPFTEHWNGKKWSRVKVASPGYYAQTSALSASGSHAYLAGTSSAKTGTVSSAFVLVYSGGKWRNGHAASPGHSSQLNAISVSSAGGAAVGQWSRNGECGVAHPTPFVPLAENLGGSSWHKVSAPLVRYGVATLRRPDALPRVPAC